MVSRFWACFVFSRRILEENEPDYYSGKFFFLFFFVRPQNVCVVDTFYRTTKSTAPASGIISELLQRVPPFVYSIFNVRYKTGRNYRVPPLNFFRHCATFRNFFIVPKGSPLGVFCYFATECVFINQKGSPLLHFSALRDIFRKKIFFSKISSFFQKNVLRFLRLRYSADLRRSRLVSFRFERASEVRVF